MNTQIIGYRISYIIFSIFVSCLIVFTIHKGFQPQDIITIPIFAILLFLIIDFSAKSMYQNNIEKFLIEGFDSRLLDRFSKESFTEEEGMIRKDPAMEKEMYRRKDQAMEKEMNRRKDQAMEKEMNRRKDPAMEKEMYRRKDQAMEKEMNRRKDQAMEKEMYRRKATVMEEEYHVHHAQEEEESYPKYMPVSDKPTDKRSASKPSSTPNGDKKAKEATDKQEERPDINKHLMDDGNNGLSNRNSETINPININVSYNNNRPFTVNDFNNPDIDKNTQNGKIGQRTTDLNSFRFDDGCKNHSISSGIDGMIQNQNQNQNQNQTQNQKYFPAYLENPLNKNQPKVDDNYEMKMMKRILNEQNDPSPVLLENPWSEWKPVDKEG